MSEALVTPELLRWARERSHLNPHRAANKIKVSPERLMSWEKGEARPSFAKARELAQKFNVPFGYLFLSSPPKEEPVIPDLRTVSHTEYQPLSTVFLDLLNDIIIKQQWYRDYIRDEGKNPVKFMGRFSIQDNAEVVAEDIRKRLNLTEEHRKKAKNWSEFFVSLIHNVESLDIIVLRSGIVGSNTHRKLSVQEFRGFAISDDYAPLIFINGRDSVAAKIFTLAHEIAHIWIGESGISNVYPDDITFENNKRVETFCNNVAAEMLVPQKQFMDYWQAGNSIDNNIGVLAHHFRVSTIVVLHRAYDLHRIDQQEFQTYYHIETEKQKPPTQGRGGDFYPTLYARNGKQLTQSIISATLEGRLLYRDAARMLGVKVKTLDGIARELGLR